MPKINKKDKNFDTECSQIIANSISDILRYSLDEDFRKRTFDLLGVSSPKETEEVFFKKLIAIVENKKIRKEVFLESNNLTGNINVDKETDKQTDKEADLQNIEEENLFSTVFSKRNWLEISNKQYRDNMKRKKLKFYSQPTFTQESNDYDESGLSSFSLQYYDSLQSNSDFSPSFSSSQEMTSSSELYEENTDFCKKKFHEMYNRDISKYLKININSKKYNSF